MRPRLRSEDGNALVTAILVTFLVLTVGLTTAATVDTQQRESRKQRERESTFQLTEALLNTQIFQMSLRWPGNADSPYPTSCTAASVVPDCPRAASVTTGYTGPDYGRLSWVTAVRDNGGSLRSYYDDTQAGTQPQWDANGDHMMWVRAEARLVDPANSLRFKRRVVVALVRAESIPLRGLPVATLVVDHFETTNTGNKVIIDGNGANNEFLTGDIVVRCEATNFTTDKCVGVTRAEQIDPNHITYRPNPPRSTLSPEQLDLLRSRARQEGNYFATGCAPSLAGDRLGEVVFMESTGATGCSYTANTTYNAAATPGVVIVGSGKLFLAGTSAFYGLIYHANLAGSEDFLVELGGDTTVFGSIQVAGKGGVRAGSSKENLIFDPRSIENIKTYGTAGIVQNSFRELQVPN